MSVIVPSWFKLRQGTLEPAGEQLYRLSGPNLTPAFIGVRPAGEGRWQAFLRWEAAGPDVQVTEPIWDTLYDAWEAAFELYRRAVVV
jgi:hypothetical protein